MAFLCTESRIAEASLEDISSAGLLSLKKIDEMKIHIILQYQHIINVKYVMRKERIMEQQVSWRRDMGQTKSSTVPKTTIANARGRNLGYIFQDKKLDFSLIHV